MEELTAKEFAERCGISEMQMRRVLGDKERYPWERYGIDYAHKLGGRWRVKPREAPMAVTARGSAEMVDGIASIASMFESRYPISRLLADLQTQGAPQVMSNIIQRWPQPPEVFRRLADVSRTAPPPHEAISRIKPLLQ